MTRLSNLLGNVANERGKKNEDRALEACLSERRPAWMQSARASTHEEDASGIDVVVESDVGKLFVQVKSSRRGKAEFGSHRRRALIGIIVVSAADDAARLLAKVTGALGPIRKSLLEKRRSF